MFKPQYLWVGLFFLTVGWLIWDAFRGGFLQAVQHDCVWVVISTFGYRLTTLEQQVSK